MTTPALPGILIEGTDFVGKTTLANSLVSRLKQRGVVAEHRKCFLNKSAIVAFLSDFIDGHTLEERDWLLTAAYLLDDACPEQLTGFAIQERNWFSQIVRNEFFHGAKFQESTAKIEERHFQFDVQIYLSSNIDAKKRRAAARAPKGPRDQLLAADPALHQRFDDYSLSRLPKNEPWMIIDTSDISPDELCARVLSAAEQVIKRRVGAESRDRQALEVGRAVAEASL
jgi:thymidylate kinase